MWQTDRRRLIALAGAAVAILMLVLNLGFLFRPGTGEVLGGLAHHAFVLGLMLVLTSGSRTVSLSTLGMFWLIGVWSVFAATYVVQKELASIFGADIDGEFVIVWLSTFTDEALKLSTIALFLLMAVRAGRQPSMSDGLLLGFMVGAGVSFQEDAHVGAILLSGDGWGAAKPWSTVFPTVSPLDSYFALNHALWAALSGLSISAAVMFRHWRWAWPIALAGPLLGLTNHVMANHFTFSEFGTQALLTRVSGGGVPFFFEAIRDLTIGGRLPMLALIGGAVAVVIAEALILRWVSKRDLLFPPLPRAQVFNLLGRATSKAGVAQLLAADRYLRLRRCVYFSAWRTNRIGGYPEVSDADYERLVSLADRLEILSPPQEAPPAAAPDDAPAEPPAPAAALPVSDAPAGNAPPAG
jgi:hypothetical protein